MTILDDILRARRARVPEWKRQRSWSALAEDPIYAQPRRPMDTALRRYHAAGEGAGEPAVERAIGRALDRAGLSEAAPSPPRPIRFLSEIKRASPSAGEIRPGTDAAAVAEAYRDAGASAISLVTEEDFFRGRLEDLPLVRAAGLPVLMKDFLVDPYQVALARALGADAVLLIAAIEDRPLLRELREAARELELQVLIEIHEAREAELAHELLTEMTGVNNRDLRTFQVDLQVSASLLPLLPSSSVRLSESGIRTRDDVLRLQEIGFDALLVGESLMRAPDPGAALRQLRGEDP